jgi:hypothetical protein
VQCTSVHCTPPRSSPEKRTVQPAPPPSRRRATRAPCTEDRECRGPAGATVSAKKSTDVRRGPLGTLASSRKMWPKRIDFIFKIKALIFSRSGPRANRRSRDFVMCGAPHASLLVGPHRSSGRGAAPSVCRARGQEVGGGREGREPREKCPTAEEVPCARGTDGSDFHL